MALDIITSLYYEYLPCNAQRILNGPYFLHEVLHFNDIYLVKSLWLYSDHDCDRKSLNYLPIICRSNYLTIGLIKVP